MNQQGNQSYKGYHRNIANDIIEYILWKKKSTNEFNSNKEKDKTRMVFINKGCAWEKAEHSFKTCFKKVRHSIISVWGYSVTKISFSHKYEKLNKSNIVSQFLHSGCDCLYVRKTEWALFKRTKECVTSADSCNYCIFSIKNLISNDVNTYEVETSNIE